MRQKPALLIGGQNDCMLFEELNQFTDEDPLAYTLKGLFKNNEYKEALEKYNGEAKFEREKILSYPALIKMTLAVCENETSFAGTLRQVGTGEVRNASVSFPQFW